jgi:phosphatidylinositol-4,5-bisphosphate 3-kinase
MYGNSRLVDCAFVAKLAQQQAKAASAVIPLLLMAAPFSASPTIHAHRIDPKDRPSSSMIEHAANESPSGGISRVSATGLTASSPLQFVVSRVICNYIVSEPAKMDKKTSHDERPTKNVKEIVCKPSDECKMAIGAAVYFGGVVIGEEVMTPFVEPRQLMSFDATSGTLRFGCDIANLPKGCRLCLTLYLKSKKEMRPVGGLAIQLFDWQGQFRSGAKIVSMWSGPPNTIGVCSANASFDSIGTVFFSLPVYSPRPAQPPLVMSVSVVEPGPENSKRLLQIYESDVLYRPDASQKELLWQHRHWAMRFPKALPKVLLCVNWTSKDMVEEAVSLLDGWTKPSAEIALCLLDAAFGESRVREYAVRALEDMSGDYLLGIMLQLTQALKYEPYHDSALAMFLLQRACGSRRIGHRFFWYLKAEVHQPEIRERYGLLLEAYLLCCGDFIHDIVRENFVLNSLTCAL